MKTVSSLELWTNHWGDFQMEGGDFPSTKRAWGMSEQVMGSLCGPLQALEGNCRK